MNPRSQRGELAIEHVPARVKLRLCAVVVVGGVHRSDNRQIIGARSDVRDPIAHLDAGLPVFAVTNLQRVELVALLAIGVVDDGDAGELELVGTLRVLVRRLADRLARVLVELGLGVK